MWLISLISVENPTLTFIVQPPVLISRFFYVYFVLQFYLNLCNIIIFFVSIVYYVLLSTLLFCCLSFSINLSCVLFQFCVFNMYINFLFIVYAFIVQNPPLISHVFDIPSVLKFCLSLYIGA